MFVIVYQITDKKQIIMIILSESNDRIMKLNNEW